MLKLSSFVELRNIEDNTLMEFYQRPEESGGISPWFETLTASENWVRRQEEVRLQSMRRPDTKWVYERTKIVYAKVIMDRHPLFLGLGRLPDWLRNKRGVLSLDTYNDKRCLFRCIAVHQGAHVRNNMRRTRELEKSFFTQRPGLCGRLTEKHLPLLEQYFKQGIAAYTVQPNGDFILTHLPANYDRVGKPVLNMGLYAGHAFLIQDLAQVARSYTCGGCQARFTRSNNLLRHTSRCTGGQTKVVCPNNRIQFPPSAYEKAFYPETRCSFIAIKWLEWEAKQRGIHIHHARCGHGGERKILGARVDGYHPETKTIFQYHGCFWHGCKQTDAQSKEILQWVTQVPVVGFNSGHYDLKLIGKYYVPLMAKDKEVFAAEKNGRIMFINTPKFKFLDVLNYLAPGITYDKWVKTYGATLTKSWLPYEWFDSPDKLDFPGLPPYMAWYSKLKGEYVLTLKEYDDCHRIFREKGMRTFGDWLEYYNNLDVAPFLEALPKMKEFYTDLGVDIFKDAVSLPGVSKQYLLRKTLQPRRGYKPPELYIPNKEAYAMLKAAVVGGPSLVFTRKHVAGETHIRSHQYEDAKVCRRILGYDANSLYPSTMMKEMPCGPGVVTTRDNPEAAALVFPQLLYTKEWFGFAEVDIEVPEELWSEFEEFPPLFVNRGVPDSAVPNHMHDYLKQSGRKRFPEQLKLLGVLSAKKILLYAPLLEWYLNRGLKLTAVYRTIDYKPREIFSWFVNEVADNRRKGDADKDKALLAEVFKLLGNSAYGKFIEAVERQNRTLYTCDEEEVDKHLRSAWFQDLEEIGDAYKIELRKDKITIKNPFQVGIVVYQLAKLRMLQFYSSSWTSTSTGRTSSSFRWTRTACTSHSPTRSSRTLSARGTRPSSRRTRSVG